MVEPSVYFHRLYVEGVAGQGSGDTRLNGTRRFPGSPVIENNLAGFRALSKRRHSFAIPAFIKLYELAISQHQAKIHCAHAYRAAAGFNSMFHFNATIRASRVSERTGPVASFGTDCLCVR